MRGAAPAGAPAEGARPGGAGAGTSRAERADRARLSANVRWALLGTASSAAANWLMVVLLARSSGPEAVGTYVFALALTAPVMSFASLQLRSLLASDPQGSYGFREYRKLTYLTTALGILASLLIALAAGSGSAAWPVLGAVCAMRAADAIAEIYRGLWQQKERMRVIGVGRLLQFLVSVTLVAVIIRMGGGAAGVAAGAALGSLTLLAFMHAWTAGDPEVSRALAASPAPVRWSRLWSLAAQGLPLGVILLLGELQSNVPRYFIERTAGKAALGLFAAANQLTTSGQLVVGALGSAALPRLAAWHAAGSAAFGDLARKLVLGGALFGAAGVLASALVGRQVLALVYKPEFGEAAGMLVVLSVAAGLGFVGSLLGYALTASRVIAVQPVILAITLAVIVLACALLSSRHGGVGVAWALVAGSAVQVAASQVALHRSRAARPAG